MFGTFKVAQCANRLRVFDCKIGKIYSEYILNLSFQLLDSESFKIGYN